MDAAMTVINIQQKPDRLNDALAAAMRARHPKPPITVVVDNIPMNAELVNGHYYIGTVPVTTDPDRLPPPRPVPKTIMTAQRQLDAKRTEEKRVREEAARVFSAHFAGQQAAASVLARALLDVFAILGQEPGEDYASDLTRLAHFPDAIAAKLRLIKKASAEEAKGTKFTREDLLPQHRAGTPTSGVEDEG